MTSVSLPNFPEKIILMVTTHGTVKTRPEAEDVDAFRVPEDVRFVKLNIANLGDCNFTTELSVDNYAQAIHHFLPDLMTADSEDEYLDALIPIMDSMRIIDKHRIIPQIKTQDYTDKTEEERTKGYLSSFRGNKQYKINMFSSGDITVNKVFSRSNEEAVGYDFSIIMINVEGSPDLLSWMFRRTRYGKAMISLSEVITYLKSQGVKEIVLFDLACSLFTDYDASVDQGTNVYLNERETRRMRRSLRKKSQQNKGQRMSPYGIYGGKKKRSRRRKTTKKRKVF